ncbi:MAG: ClpXP protease specificity-enhancing factor [Acidiferrobacterales bacterium]
MTPIKPFLIDAVREWAVENGLTPQIVVAATLPGVKVPQDYVENGRILLNIHPQAVHGFGVQNSCLMFSARFGGQAHSLEIPVAAIRAVYARENGKGVAFPEESSKEEALTDEAPADPPSPPSKKGPHLKVVK